MTRRIWAATAVLTLTGVFLTVPGPVSVAEPRGRFGFDAQPGRPQLSGVADPQWLSATGVVAAAGVPRADVAVVTEDIQANGDNKADPRAQFGSGAGYPANETVIAINPTNPNNVIAGSNDYESAVDS